MPRYLNVKASLCPDFYLYEQEEIKINKQKLEI